MNKWILIAFLVSLPHLLAAQTIIDNQGALIRSDTSVKSIYLLFSAHEYDEGFDHILNVLQAHEVPASFFLTGDFVREHQELVRRIHGNGHYIGAHSDKHLLYVDWVQRDSLLVSETAIKKDIQDNLYALNQLQIYPDVFLPSFEWYNKAVVRLVDEVGQSTINFSRGTRSNADYTTPEMPNYISSDRILQSIYTYEEENGMNGFHLLIHPGTSPDRMDKFYYHLNSLLIEMKKRGYSFERF